MKIRHLFFFLVALTCIACSSSPHISDLRFEKNYQYAYLDNKAFDGTIWSSDNKRMSITCDNGLITKICVYHSNGNIALFSNAFFELGKFYNENGDEITVDEFMINYPLLVEDIATITDSFLKE